MKDIDDLLRSAGRERAPAVFAELLASAVPVKGWLVDELAHAPSDKRNDLAERAAALVMRSPPLEQDALRKRMAKALDTSMRTVNEILAQAKRSRPQALAPKSGGPRGGSSRILDDLRYRWTAEGLERVELVEVEGQQLERAKTVANFLIRIERETEVIDDLRNRKEYECRLLLAGDAADAPGRSLRIDGASFGSNTRLGETLAAAGHWDARCSAKHVDFVRMASSAFSGERGVKRVRRVRFIGYSETADGEDLGYVTPSVIIRAGEIIPAAQALDGSGLRCELPTEGFKSIRRLGLAAITADECRSTLRHIVDDLLCFKGPEIGRAFTGHAFLAPVFGRLRGFKPYVLAILGNSGLGKSTIAGYFQAFFGSGFTDLDMESWTATPKAIELAGHLYKDALYVVDDFKLGHFSAPALRDAMRVLQAYADGAGRNRLSRASTMMPSAYIRGMLAITGEDLPEGESSNLARIVPLRVPNTPVTPELTAVKRRCDASRRHYAGVMAHYIAWTQRKPADYFQERAQELFATLEADPVVERVNADNKSRVIQNLTLNLLGFVLWAEFAGEMGVLDESEAQRMVQEHYEALKGIFHGHVETVTEERPFALFLRHVQAMLDSEAVRLASIALKSHGGFGTDGAEKPSGRGNLVGYDDGTYVYFLHDAVFKELGEYRARGRLAAGEFSKREVMRQLLEEGILVPNPSRSGTNDVKKHSLQVDGQSKRVMKVLKARLNG